jgi:hypothetical protein
MVKTDLLQFPKAAQILTEPLCHTAGGFFVESEFALN